MLDANYAGRGHFNQRRLAHLAATVAGGEVEFVIPEVVLWEWAEHAAAVTEALLEEHKRFPVCSTVFPLPSMPPPLEIIDLVAAIIAALPRNFHVWRPPATDWRGAVRAQVLQTGTGERKDGVKTGAADHLVLSCVRAQIDERLAAEAVVLATADKHLRRECERAFGDELLCASNDHELLARLIEFQPAADDLSESVERQLTDLIQFGDSDIATALANFAMGVEIVDGNEPSSTERERVNLTSVDIVELHELEVGEFAAGERVGYAHVRIFGDVYLEWMTLERVGEDDFEWGLTDAGTVTGVMIDVRLTVTLTGTSLRRLPPAGRGSNFNPAKMTTSSENRGQPLACPLDLRTGGRRSLLSSVIPPLVPSA